MGILEKIKFFEFHFRLLGRFVLLNCLCVQVSAAQQEVDNAQLAKTLQEMQSEIRLIVKEVVSLQKKVDALSSGVNANAGVLEKKVEKQVRLPASDRLVGSSEAKYAMIEFMDYQCPYCIRYAKQVLPTLKQRYVDTGKLRYGIMDFPLGFHSKAEGAAIAANCAGVQGKYWAMHDDLIYNSKRLGNKLYMELAQKNELDLDTYSSCLLDPKQKEGVAADFSYGTEVGTRGTPNFFIGRIEGDSVVDVVQISGSRSVEAFDRAIQEVFASN